MDKRTLLAVVLSVVVISIGFFLQGVLFPSKPKPTVTATQTQTVQQTEPTTTGSQALSGGNGSSSQNGQSAQAGTAVVTHGVVPDPADANGLKPETYTIKTDLFEATFSNVGGVVTSLRLLKHLDNGKPLDMVFSGQSGQAAFNLSFGGPESAYTKALFHLSRLSDTTYEFSRKFLAPANPGSGQGGSVPFTLTKTFIFHPDSYMFELKIGIRNSVNQYPNLDNKGYAYTLEVGPQIGPPFETLGGRGEYRKYYVYADGKRKTIGVPSKGIMDKPLDYRVSWAAIVGKYFTVIGVPDATKYAVTYSNAPIEGIPDTSEMFFSRPPVKSSVNTDVFQFYVGPKTANTLDKYDTASKNSFGASGLNLGNVLDQSRLLGWLESILKFFLKLFYSLIPNWGVAIVLLVVLIKIVLYPFTRKSFESSSKMQALTPKINELREKYKSNPTKMNQEMAALYKKEGVSPFGGCLPLLLQMPVFFALYYLLNSEFSLRGAVFIPGWITDLSQPESILHLPFTIPIIGWSDIRALPIIYVGTQLISSRLMQNPDVATSKNMRMITYLMPAMFFFILYNAPSGLILYWTVMNILTVAQQMYMNRHRRRLAAAGGGGAPGGGKTPATVARATSIGGGKRKTPAGKRRR